MQMRAWRHGGARLTPLGAEEIKYTDKGWSAIAEITYFIGRVLFGLVFIIFGVNQFNVDSVHFAESQGVPYPYIVVPVSGAMAMLGALCVISGIGIRFGAVLLIVFLIPVTLIMHDFWNFDDPHMVMIQRMLFFRNLSMLGAAIIIGMNGASQKFHRFRKR